VVDTYYVWGYRLEHREDTTIHHEFGIMQQIEYDEQEFIKTSVLDQVKTSDNAYNYVDAKIEVDNFAEPEKLFFEFEVEIPLQELYKGNDFQSGNLGKYIDEVLGVEKQILKIPYRIVSGDNEALQYLPVEMSISVNSVVLSAEIVSSADSRFNASISHASGYPQLLASTALELPWTPTMDHNLRSGKIRGLVKYDPINNSQIVVADYYPKDAVNRETSMFLMEEGIVKENPQIYFSNDWQIDLKTVTDLNVTHQAITVSQILEHVDNDAEDYFNVALADDAILSAYLPVWGQINQGYIENGYALFVRSADKELFQEDSSYADIYDQSYQMNDLDQAAKLLGFVDISKQNSNTIIRLVSSGTKGTAEAISNKIIGTSVSAGAVKRVHAYDYRSWLDLAEDSLVSENVYYITLTPEAFDVDEMNLPAYMADPFGPIYNMQPHGLNFNPLSRPLLTSVLYNTASSNVDLSRLVVYHKDSNDTLSLAGIFAVKDSDNDGYLAQNESGYMISYVEGFSEQFYIPALRKLNFDSYQVYSNSANVSLIAHGQPTGNIQGFIDGLYDFENPYIDKGPDTPSGDYVIDLTLTEGLHTFEAREYRLVNSAVNPGPMSDPVEILIDLSLPSLSAVRLYNLISSDVLGKQLKIDFNSSEKASLEVNVSDNIILYPCLRGNNSQIVSLSGIADGQYLVTVNLLDLSGNRSNIVTSNLIYDTTGPDNLEIVSPVNGQHIQPQATIVYTVPADNLSDVVFLSLEYQTAAAWQQLITINAEVTSVTFNFFLADNTNVNLRLTAVDSIGNISYSPTVDVVIDNEAMYYLDENKLIHVVDPALHKVIELNITNNFGEAGMQLYLFRDIVDIDTPTKAVLASPYALNIEGGLNESIDLTAITENVLYLIAYKFDQPSNLITLPVNLPYVSNLPILVGDQVLLTKPFPGEISYLVNNIAASSDIGLAAGSLVTINYKPFGSELVYESDSFEVAAPLEVLLSSIEADPNLVEMTTNNYKFSTAVNEQVTINIALSTIHTSKNIAINSFNGLPTKNVAITNNYSFKIDLAGLETEALSISLEDGNTIVLSFTRDDVCYAPSSLSKELSGNQNVISWQDAQDDIAAYQVVLKEIVNGVAAVTNSATVNIDIKEISYGDLSADTFYMVELGAVDLLQNRSTTRSVTFYNGEAQVFNVKPTEYVQFQDKAVELSYPLNTFGEELLIAYKELGQEVITGNVYLYQSYSLIQSKIVLPSQNVSYSFVVDELPLSDGGDVGTLKLYYFKTAQWLEVPGGEYIYDSLLRKYYYTGADLYPLAIGAERFKEWQISGVSQNYSELSAEFDLTIKAINGTDQVVTRSSQAAIVSTNLECALNKIVTNKQGQAILPVKLNMGRGVTYNLVIEDASGVTGSLVFYAEDLPISFNVLVIDSWDRLTATGNLKEGVNYLFDIDVSAYEGADISYVVSGLVNINLGKKRQFVFRPNYDQAGTQSMDIEVYDGSEIKLTKTITFNIEDTNRKPFIDYIDGNNIVSVSEGNERNILYSVVDHDGDEINNIQFANVPNNFTFTKIPNKAMFNLDIKPDFSQSGTYNIGVILDDGKESTTRNITVLVKNYNRPPVKKNTNRVFGLENDLVVYSIDVFEPDNEPISLDLSGYPCPAGIISTQNIAPSTTRFNVWTRPGFVNNRYQSYPVKMIDPYTVMSDFQTFDIRPDTTAPAINFGKAPPTNSYAVQHKFNINSNDNVWSTFNIEVWRSGELIHTEQQITNSFNVAPTLIDGMNNLTIIVKDGAGNQSQLLHNITLDTANIFDAAKGIYVEMPVGAYADNSTVLISTHNTTDLAGVNWKAGHMPYAIGQFNNEAILTSFTDESAAPLDSITTSLNRSIKFVVRVKKPNDPNSKVNPVIWSPEKERWCAHTVRRLTPDEFGPLAIPTSSFNLQADEELVYFESPVLGVINMMNFITTERPRASMTGNDYYDTGTNFVQFYIRGNYLRLENTKAWLNGVTLNIDFDADYYQDNITNKNVPLSNKAFSLAAAGDPVLTFNPANNMFTLQADNFQNGNNLLQIYTENLVHSALYSFTLQSNTGSLSVRDIYAYPNPATSRGDQMIRFSYILSKRADVDIRIYTSQGKLIQKLDGTTNIGFNAVAWDGKDKWGNQVANGMYIYVIIFDDGDRKIIKKKKVGILL